MNNDHTNLVNAIADIQKDLQAIRQLPRMSPEFHQWRMKAENFLRNNFGDSSIEYLKMKDINFEPVNTNNVSEYDRAYWKGITDSENFLSSLKQQIESKTEINISNSAIESIIQINNRFHKIAHQIKKRHNNRTSIIINDEYDVQDLYHALLLLYFQDVRPEDPTSIHAGGSSRVDFLIREHNIVIEVKKTRSGLTDRELGEQLSIDIQRYKSHKHCKHLICFVYDPDGLINNPRGIERDLTDTHGSIEVIVQIRPNH